MSSMKLNDSYMNLNYDICHSSFHNYKGLTVRKWKFHVCGSINFIYGIKNFVLYGLNMSQEILYEGH